MKYSGLLVMLLLIITAFRVAACDITGASLAGNDRIRCMDDYSIIYHQQTQRPLAAQYRVTNKNRVTGMIHRDPRAWTHTEEEHSYRREIHQSGFDYAHLASEKLAGINQIQRSMSTNRVAMANELNRQGGLWAQLEEYEVYMAHKFKALNVFAGVIYPQDSLIPSHFYKIYVQPDLLSSAVFLMPNMPPFIQSLKSAVSTIDCIERLSGLNIVIPGIEAKHEASMLHSLQIWSQGGNEKTCEVHGG